MDNDFTIHERELDEAGITGKFTVGGYMPERDAWVPFYDDGFGSYETAVKNCWRFKVLHQVRTRILRDGLVIEQDG